MTPINICKFCANPVGFSCPLQGPDYDLNLALSITGRQSPAGYDVVDVCSDHYHALQIVIKACGKLEKLKRVLTQTLEAISGESAVIDAFAAKLEAHEGAYIPAKAVNNSLAGPTMCGWCAGIGFLQTGVMCRTCEGTGGVTVAAIGTDYRSASVF